MNKRKSIHPEGKGRYKKRGPTSNKKTAPMSAIDYSKE
jgi:hypothetical protein